MSWEVWTMKSRISFFNPGLSRNLLRRCWPLWTAYLLVLILTLPAAMMNHLRMMDADGVLNNFMDMYLLQSARVSIFISFAAGLLAVMAMFSFLYFNRSCGMINALPLRRETVFCTAWLTGIAPLLLCQIFVTCITALLLGRHVEGRNLGMWLAVSACSMLAFYGMASFCAMLTGNLIVLPAVYVVLNLAATVAESCLVNLLDKLLYGYSSGNLYLLWFSPVAKLWQDVQAVRQDAGGPFHISHFDAVLVYAAVGLLLSMLALQLYRRRAMETATDTVAIPVLKPVFKYCMAFGTALVFASSIFSLVLGGSLDGRAAALLILFLLLFGAFLGYYLAEMMIQKTVRVFFQNAGGLLAVFLVLAVFIGACELDLFGYERRVPEAEDLAWAALDYDIRLERPEDIEKVVALHRSVLEHREQHEHEIHDFCTDLKIWYELKDGSGFCRHYYISGIYGGFSEDYSDVLLVQEILNLPDAMDQRNNITIRPTADIIYDMSLNTVWYDKNGRNTENGVMLTPEQGEDFFQNCVLPDLADHSLGHHWMVFDDTYYDTVMNLNIQVDLRLPREGSSKEYYYQLYSIQLEKGATRCLNWIRENTDLEPVPMGELDFDRGTQG